jgi:type I restriction enzyme M protein
MGDGRMSDQQLRLFIEPGPPSQKAKHFASKRKVLGQFFTPLAVARFMVSWAEVVGIPKGVAVDPACGDGVFLKELVAAGFKHIVGVDIDGDVLGGLADKVPPTVELRQANGLTIPLESFADFVVGNPPFSAKFGRIKDRSVLSRFTLGRGRVSQAPEVLFLEKFTRIAKPGGLIAIILPEGIFASLPMQPVRDYILSHLLPLAVIGLSRRFFPAKTSILIARKEWPCPAMNASWPVFLAMADDEDDLDELIKLYADEGQREMDFALWKPLQALQKNMSVGFHLPMPDVLKEIDPSIPLIPLSRLLESIRTGQTEYGPRRRFTSSGIRFIGASAITPLGLDFQRAGHRFVQPGGPMDKKAARTQVGDVLFVRVGVGCAGRVAVVLNDEECGIADDYIYIMRFKEGVLPGYFALYAATKFFKVQIERLKRGVGTVNIPQNALETVLVPVPTRAVQERFDQLYRRLHDQAIGAQEEARRKAKDALAEAVTELEALLQGRLSYAKAETPGRVG